MATRRWLLSAFVAVLVVALAGVALVPEAPVQAAPSATQASGAEQDALAAASRSGVPVQVAGSQTEVSREWANPTGGLTFESYAVPHWVSSAQGSWRQIDKRLRLDDGVLHPVATLTDTHFSPGGNAPLVSLPVGGGSMSLSWPAALPAPRLEGDTAVYPSVLDGVDLRVRAIEDGFSWSLLVQSREAAENPALDSLRFRVATTGLSTATDPDGGFVVRDGSGATVLSADNAVMWDSAGTTAGARQALAHGSDPAQLLEEAPDVAHRVELPTQVVGSDLVITPDVSVLRGPSTVYPVVIDPSTTLGKIRWAYVNQSNANKNDGVARVGDDPDGTGMERSYFAYNLASLAGKQIRSAKFFVTMTHSYSCTSTAVSLFRTADVTAAGRLAWDGPDVQKYLQVLSGHAHKPSGGAGCGDDPQPNLPMEYSAAALRTDIDASKGQTNYTLGLIAGDSAHTGEGDEKLWKKFDPATAKLSVEYNTPPNTPTAAQMTLTPDYTAPAVGCVTGSGRPAVRSVKPWLKAILSDPDGSGGGSLRGDFTLQRLNGTTWTGVSLSPSYKAGVAPGNKAELQISTTLASGDVLRWEVKTSDTLGGASGVSGWCEFQVDTTGPQATPSVTSADGLYPEETPDDVVHGGKGLSGQFTFGANGQADVAAYTYRLNGGPVLTATAAAAGGSVTVWVTPNKQFDNVLTVNSRDKAGNVSAPEDYTFLVDQPSAPFARWDLDEGSGTTASGSPGPDLQLANGPAWTDDRLVGTRDNVTAKAVQFNGVNQSLDSAAAVLDTSKSFSVAAWVKLAKNDTYQTIISQQGTYTSAFYLQATPASVNKWRFARISKDAAGYTATSVFSDVTEQVGVWTHIAGVYDAGTQEMRLYINGVLAGSATYSNANAWNAAGPTHLARAFSDGHVSDFSAATIGEARFWDRVVDPADDLAPLVEPVLVASWEMDDFDDEAPRQVTDDSGYDRPLTLSENPHATQPGQLATQWTNDGYNFSTGLLTDGVGGHAETDGRVVRTDQSFSVAAWVRRDSNTGFQAVWGQDGVVNSSAYFRYQDNYTGGAWVFGMRSKDDSTGVQAAAFQVGTAATWTHLVCVYDATAGEMRLYVNGVFKATNPYRPTWDSTGAFSVGRMKYLSGNINSWNGAIDRVRVWQGALSQDTITNLYLEP